MSTKHLAPYAPEWLGLEQMSGGRNIMLGTPDELRAQYRAITEASAPLKPPLADTVTVKDDMIDGHLKVKIYTPKDSKPDGPVGIYFFGGGWVMGDVDTESWFAHNYAAGTNTVVVSATYRLAPEHKYPAAHDDAKKALSWVVKNAPKLNVSPNKIYTMGTSAGGNIAISLALHSLNTDHPVKGVAALAPLTVHPFIQSLPAELQDQFKRRENEDSAIINTASVKTMMDAYQPPEESPDFSVLLSPDLAKMPPTYLAVCGKDPLRDDGLAFEKKLKEAGGKTKINLYEGFPHVFWGAPIPAAQAAMKDIIAGLNWVVENIEA